MQTTKESPSQFEKQNKFPKYKDLIKKTEDLDISTKDHNNEETNLKNEIGKIRKNKIYVSNLEYNVHEHLLKNFLSKFGKVKRCKLLRNSYNKKPTGVGFVDFYTESDAENVIKAKKEDLILNGRDLVVKYYVDKRQRDNKPSKKINQTEAVVSRDDTETEEKNSELNLNNNFVNKLPYNILLKIFSYLCIRDLCTVEQVCKHWYKIAKMAWSSKRTLILNEKNIFENYVSRGKNRYGFCSRPDFNVKAFRQIFDKKLTNLRYIDISDYYSKFLIDNSEILRILSEECLNLEYLNIANMNVSNKGFTPLIKKTSKLKEINITFCSQLSDASLSKIFQHCPDLEKFNFSGCYTLNGSCFERIKNDNHKITSAILNDCDKIEESNLILFLSKCKNLKYLSIKRGTQISTEALLYLINNSSNLETLILASNGFDSLLNLNCKEIEFEKLGNLKALDISRSNCNNDIVFKILNEIKSLKSLNLNYCSRLNDDMFKLCNVSSSLEELDLSFIRQITDTTLNLISKLMPNLKTLRIQECPNLTKEGIIELLTKSNITYLDVKQNFRVDNSLLETALKLDYRNIYILCHDTLVNTNKFVFDHENTTKEVLDRDCILFKYKNLSFEAFNTKLKYDTKYDYWLDDSFYMGSNSDDSDLDNFCTFNDDYYDENENYHDNDDLEEFMEEEQEMFNELEE